MRFSSVFTFALLALLAYADEHENNKPHKQEHHHNNTPHPSQNLITTSKSSTVTSSHASTTTTSHVSSTSKTSTSSSSSKTSSHSTTTSSLHSSSTKTTSSSSSHSSTRSSTSTTTSSLPSPSSSSSSVKSTTSSTSQSSTKPSTTSSLQPSGSSSSASVKITSSSTSLSSASKTTSVTSTSSVTSPTSALANYAYDGCYTDALNGMRVLTGASLINSTGMTVEMCATFCFGFSYFGVEYGDECYCGNSFAAQTIAVVESDCNVPCSGSPSEVCGAGLRISRYILSNLITTTTSASASPTPTGPPSYQPTVSGYALVGCQAEAAIGKALTGSTIATGSMTNEFCAWFCQGYAYFGTEYSRECYCGNSLDPTSFADPISDCNLQCVNNPSEYCGGSNRMLLYSSASSTSSSFVTSTTSSISTTTSSPP